MPDWSGSFTLAAAAKELGLTRERVRVLVESGRLSAEMVAGRWLVTPAALEEYRGVRRRGGRPLAARTVWKLIDNGLIARLLLAADAVGQRNIRTQLIGRAEVRDVFVLPQLVGKIDHVLSPGGRALAESADVPAGRDGRWALDAYLRRQVFDELVARKRIADVGGEPNARLRVVDDDVVWWGDAVGRPPRSTALVVAWLDLADSGDRAADMTLKVLLAAARSSGVEPFPVGGEVLAKASLSVLSALNDELSR